MLKPTTVLSVDGFEVTATFAENHNAAAVHYVKQILISSFAGKTTKLQSRDILVAVVLETTYSRSSETARAIMAA